MNIGKLKIDEQNNAYFRAREVSGRKSPMPIKDLPMSRECEIRRRVQEIHEDRALAQELADLW